MVSLPLCVEAQGSFREEFEQFRKQSITTYVSFREQCNKDYVEFLKSAWKSYQKGPVIPKPVEEEVPPVVIEKDRDQVPIEENDLPYDEVVPVIEEESQPQPVEPVMPTPVIQESFCEFDYFGTLLKVHADDKQKFVLASINGEDVAKAWERLSDRAYDIMLADCLKIREDYKMCDWAYLMMLGSFAKSYLHPGNEAVLLSAYLYAQSGYKMRLGVADNELCLLFGSKHQIYGLPYYEIDGYCYYRLNGDSEEMKIANFAFPKEQGLSLAITAQPRLSRDESELRTLTAKGYKTVSACSVNKNLLSFYENYPTSQLDDNPMTRWALYANAPLDGKVKAQLYPALKKAIAGKTLPQAADILLDFVQTAFEYEYDDKVWGHDRAFFAEESLYYPYCDCEDRSILYSHLVRDLLGLDVILVYYPGHLATAVRFPEPLKGDCITLNKNKYLVCDPTYIGAPIGVTMPDMDNKKAKVILLK